MREAKPVERAIAQIQAGWDPRISLATLPSMLRLLLVAIAAFGAASFVAALPSTKMLVTSRAAQGLAAALFAPAAFFLLRSLFSDPDQRRLAISVWTYSFTLGAAIGSPVCGIFLNSVDPSVSLTRPT